ncbi:hypothetical protein C8J57DRAFT_1247989 [Mycena rebaudengoi]|nr:hypothetical protein C8J57DRAFT_1247989 [Mycena rebaudengoi]
MLDPVGELPPEITSSIFLHCLPSHGHVLPSPSRAPLLLAQICRHWREVALLTGELWNSLYLESIHIIVAQARNNWHVLLALIQTWFSRAKAAPLSLGLNCRFVEVSPALMEVVSSFAGQIQRLDLHLDLDQLRHHRPFQTRRFPLLQHLATNAPEAEIGVVLKDTPSLRELRLVASVRTSVIFLLPLLSWLEISAQISITTFLSVLNNFPVLSHFKYNLSEPDTNGVDGFMTQVFPRLSSLAGSAAAPCFITLPGLQALELPNFSDPDHVPQFLARSSCTVDHLTLSMEEYYEDADGEQLRTWLTAFPALSVLRLRGYMRVDVLIACLASETSLMPRLAEITIDSSIRESNIDNNYDDALVSLLRHPRRSPKLRKFHMLFNTDLYIGYGDIERRVWTPGALVETALNNMIADGLDFLLRTKSVDRGITLTWPPTYIDLTDPLPSFL